MTNNLQLTTNNEIMQLRKNIVAGNWKMNKTAVEAAALINEINQGASGLQNVQLVLCTPAIYLESARKNAHETISIGAQNCYCEIAGAFTGEISAAMLSSVGVSHVIIGHSERRQIFSEKSKLLSKKVDIALVYGLTPIYCCGEPLEIRETGLHFSYVKSQITRELFHLSETDFSKLVIAYEPIWAIGTGKTATVDEAQEMHAALRNHISKKYGKDVADSISILYGGSCNAANAASIFSQPDVDGGLIGGASLKSTDFLTIAQSFPK